MGNTLRQVTVVSHGFQTYSKGQDEGMDYRCICWLFPRPVPNGRENNEGKLQQVQTVGVRMVFASAGSSAYEGMQWGGGEVCPTHLLRKQGENVDTAEEAPKEERL